MKSPKRRKNSPSPARGKRARIQDTECPICQEEVGEWGEACTRCKYRLCEQCDKNPQIAAICPMCRFYPRHKTARTNLLNLLRYMHAKGYSIDRVIQLNLAHVPSIRKLLNEMLQRGDERFMDWFDRHGYTFTEEDVFHTVRAGHVHILDWYVQHKYDLPEQTMDVAIEQENMRVVQWLYDHDIRGTMDAIRNTEKVVNRALFNWLSERGY